MSRASQVCAGFVGLGMALTLGSCLSPQVGAPCPIPEKATEAQRIAALNACFTQQGEKYYDARPQKDVDILFLIDNSRSMSPKQRALAANIPKFIKKIESFGANYHVGIATSDVGSTPSASFTYTNPDQAECNTFTGQDGQLQIMPCTQRTNQSPEARNACDALCTKPGFANATSLTTDGMRFISKIEGKTNVPVDMVLDTATGKMVDQGPITAFQCMALVGDGGCGMEAPLEGAKRALDGHRPDNAGFLRPGAALAVIFITDEEDCSVQLARRNETAPATKDCSTPDQNASWECFNTDYRCLARSMQCDQPMNQSGPHTNCKERADNFLEPVSKYHKFFSAITDKLVISGIWTRPSTTDGGKLVVQRSVSGTSSSFLSLSGGTDASCKYSGTDGNFANVWGNAQRRLSSFAEMFGKRTDGTNKALEISICDIDKYESGLDAISGFIKEILDPNCLPVAPKAPNGQPLCLVGDVDAAQPQSLPDKYFPVCSASCCQAWANALSPSTEDAGIRAACSAEASDCYCAVKSTQPTVCTNFQGWVGGVWRKDLQPPPYGKGPSFRCAGTSVTQ